MGKEVEEKKGLLAMRQEERWSWSERAGRRGKWVRRNKVDGAGLNKGWRNTCQRPDMKIQEHRMKERKGFPVRSKFIHTMCSAISSRQPPLSFRENEEGSSSDSSFSENWSCNRTPLVVATDCKQASRYFTEKCCCSSVIERLLHVSKNNHLDSVASISVGFSQT